MNTILITGANRGIGLELTRQLLQRGDRIFAGCRQPEKAAALQDLQRTYGDQLAIVQIDVMDDESVAAAKTAVSTQTDHLDILINNAGVLVPNETLADFDPAKMDLTLQVNVIGPMRVTAQFVDLLRKGQNAKLINVSSQLGSIQKMTGSWGEYSYNSSKAALNMLSRMLSHDLRGDGVTVIALHPGWVQTDMGGQNAAVTVPDSASWNYQSDRWLESGRFEQVLYICRGRTSLVKRMNKE